MSSHFQRRIALLKQPPFLAYMINLLFAAFGNGLGYIAMSWLVVNHHSNVSAMAILMGCFWGPNIIFSPLMGVLADRLPRKLIMIFSNLLRALAFIGFSFYLMHHFSVSLVYIMMLCVGIAFSAYFSTVFAFLRELVPEEDLMYANSTIDIMYEVGNVVGMGSAGLIIAWSSAQTAILINGIAFLIATAALFCIPKKALCHGGIRESKNIQFVSDFKEGLVYLSQRKSLFAVYTIQLLILITYLTTPLLLLPFSKAILHTTVEQFGVIEAFASLGIIIGGLLMPWISERYGFLKTLLLFSSALCITFAVFGYNKIIDIAIALYFVIGFAGAIWPLIISRAQSMTDLTFQGRVQSTFNSISGALMLAFYFGVGLISHYFSIAHLYWLEVIITLSAIVFLIYAQDSLKENKTMIQST